MKYTEKYRCDLCGTIWSHAWDTEDYNNDFTQCPNCREFEFDTIETIEHKDYEQPFQPHNLLWTLVIPDTISKAESIK